MKTYELFIPKKVGSLTLKNRNFKISEAHACRIIFQLCCSVAYIHSYKIIHRNIKPENILIESEEKDNLYNIKVIDFGTAKLFDKNKSEDKVIGSAYYIAPEVLNSKYNEKCDIWSSGVILYILLTGKPPFNGSDDEIVDKIKKGKYDLKANPWQNISVEAKDLIKKMLNKKYQSRISALQCLEHPFLKKEIDECQKSKETKKILKNLKNFQNQDKLQQATIAYIVHFLTPANEFEQLILKYK